MTSFSELVNSMISAYGYLSDYVGKKATNIGYINETLQFLIRLESKGNLSTKNNTDKEIAQFFRIFLDLAGIVSATKGQIEPLSIGDIKLIGKKKDISGLLSTGQTSVDDWICSVLFQGWVRMHEPDLSISRDLRYVISKYGGRRCDFEVVGTKVPRTLVECKRLHPHPFYSDKKFENDVLGLVTRKILDNCSTAKKQFDDAESSLSNGRRIRTLIVDVSSYGENCLRHVRNGIMIGLDEKTQIKTIMSQLAKEEINGIHQLVLAWSDVFFFKGARRALVYYTKPIAIDGTNLTNPQLNYEGWTVEFYPMGKGLSKYLELRLSNTASSFRWIRASWFSLTDNLLTYGSKEIMPHNNSGDNSLR